jgi:hypothetical protein
MLPHTEMTSQHPPPLRDKVIVFHSCLAFNCLVVRRAGGAPAVHNTVAQHDSALHDTCVARSVLSAYNASRHSASGALRSMAVRHFTRSTFSIGRKGDYVS